MSRVEIHPAGNVRHPDYRTHRYVPTDETIDESSPQDAEPVEESSPQDALVDESVKISERRTAAYIQGKLARSLTKHKSGRITMKSLGSKEGKTWIDAFMEEVQTQPGHEMTFAKYDWKIEEMPNDSYSPHIRLLAKRHGKDEDYVFVHSVGDVGR